MAQPSPVPGEPRLPDARRRRRGRGRRAGGVPATGPRRRRRDRRRPRLAHGGRRAAVPRPAAVGPRPPRTARRMRVRSSRCVRRTGSGRPGHPRRRGPRQRCWRCCGGCHPASGWRSCCTTCSGCRSTRSPRRSAGPSAPAVNSPDARAASSPPPRRELTDVADAEHQLVTEKFITACANGDLEALTAVLDPTVWGVGTDPGRWRAAAAGQPRPGRGRPQPASLSRARRDACQRTGRGAGSAGLRRPAAVRRHRAHRARQPGAQDRGNRRPNGGSPTVDRSGCAGVFGCGRA